MSFCDPSHAYMKGLGTGLQQIWSLLTGHHHIFRTKTVTKTRIWMANEVQILAWFAHDMMHLELIDASKELLWSITCIWERFINSSTANVGYSLPGATVHSLIQKTVTKTEDLAGKWGSFFGTVSAHVMMAFGVVQMPNRNFCDPFHAYKKGLGMCLQQMWALLTGHRHILHTKTITKTRIWLANEVRMLARVCTCHIMHLELVDAFMSFCDPSHAYGTGLGTPLQQMWALLTRHHRIFHMKTVNQNEDQAGKWGSILALVCTCAWYDAFGVGRCLPGGFWDPSSCIQERFINTSTANVGSPYLGTTILSIQKPSQRSRHLAGKWGQNLAWFVHDMMHLELVDAFRYFWDPSHAYMKVYKEHRHYLIQREYLLTLKQKSIYLLFTSNECFNSKGVW